MRNDFLLSRRVVKPASNLRLNIGIVGSGLWLSGVLWLVFHYFLQRQTDFGLHPHPLEFWWRAAHGLFGFAAVWTFGLLWGRHVVEAWASGRHRRSGGLLVGVLILMSLSGYLLYYLGGDQMIANVSLIHWGLGIALPFLFWLHHGICRLSLRPMLFNSTKIIQHKK